MVLSLQDYLNFYRFEINKPTDYPHIFVRNILLYDAEDHIQECKS